MSLSRARISSAGPSGLHNIKRCTFNGAERGGRDCSGRRSSSSSLLSVVSSRDTAAVDNSLAALAPLHGPACRAGSDPG